MTRVAKIRWAADRCELVTVMAMDGAGRVEDDAGAQRFG